jgi:hypothetical protein
LYKTWTRFVTTIITDFAEDHSILSSSQEGFRHGHSTARQMQRLVNMIEDAGRTHQDLYVLYVDFTNAFNTISHRKLFMIMKDLGFPDDVITVIKGIYTGASTKIHLHKPDGITTPSVHVGRGTIQGDTLSPLIFLIYIEPMLRWFRVGGHGYSPGCQAVRNPRLTQSALAYADDMAMLTGCYKRLIHQFRKLQAYCKWGGLTLNAKKCAVSGILHNSAYTGLARSLAEQTNLLKHRLTDKLGEDGHFVPFLPPDKPYKYLGVYITLTLDFKHQLQYLMDITLSKGKQLLAANTPARQALNIINHVLKPKITYCFPLAPFSKTDIKDLDTLLARIARLAMSLPGGFPIKATLCPTDRGGTGLLSLMTDYTQIATLTLTRTLNDRGDLGQITANMLSMQLEEYGRLPMPLRKWTRTFHSHPLPMRLLTIMHDAKLALHRHESGMIELVGNPLWQKLVACSPPESPLLARHLCPLWRLGITSFAPLITMVGGHAYVISSLAIASAYKDTTSVRHVRAAQTALNRLTLYLNGDPHCTKHTHYGPLPTDRRRITNPHDFTSIPQPTDHPLQRITMQSPPPHTTPATNVGPAPEDTMPDGPARPSHLSAALPRGQAQPAPHPPHYRTRHPIPLGPTYMWNPPGAPMLRFLLPGAIQECNRMINKHLHPLLTSDNRLVFLLRLRQALPDAPPGILYMLLLKLLVPTALEQCAGMMILVRLQRLLLTRAPPAHSPNLHFEDIPPPLDNPMPLDTHLTNLQRQGTWLHDDTQQPAGRVHNPFLPPRPSPSDQQLIDECVQINPTPVHPDFDIQPPHKFTIQIGIHVSSTGTALQLQHPDLAFVYRPDGTCVGKMSTTRLRCLQTWYDQVCVTNPQIHRAHTTGSFAQDVASLLVRYQSLKKAPQTRLAVNTHWVPPPVLTEALSRHMSANTHRFTSPLEAPPSAEQHSSPHLRDTPFLGPPTKPTPHDGLARLWHTCRL